MTEPFVGEIKMVGFNFAPRGYATCDGQIMSIQQNTALFSLLGTTYGGNGTTTFALPDLRGRFPTHQGQGPGLATRVIGEVAGQESVTLLANELPQHSHQLIGSSTGGNVSPANGFPAADSSNTVAVYGSTGDTAMHPGAIGVAGGNQPHTNMPPYLVVNFVIALEGIFPSRN